MTQIRVPGTVLALTVAIGAFASGCTGSDVADPLTSTSPTSTTSTSTTTSSTSTTSPTSLTSTSSTSPTSTSSTTTTTSTSTTTIPALAAFNVAWLGGSESALGDVSVPAAAAGIAPTIGDVPATFTAFTKIDPSPADTIEFATQAIAGGANVLVVMLNPQWLHERQCLDIEPPHVRYACLLAPGDQVGASEVKALVDAVVATQLPTLFVMLPTSADALADPELAPLIVDAHASLAALIPELPSVRVVNSEFTAGRPEFAEGVGFYDMVHPMPAGAAPLAAALVTELEQLIAPAQP